MVLACSDRALLLMAGGFEAAVLALVTPSLGVLVLVGVAVVEPGGFGAPWVPAGSALLLGLSSALVPVCVGEAEENRNTESIKVLCFI